MKANAKEFDAFRPVVVVLPGQPIPQPFRPAPVCFLKGTLPSPGSVEAVEIKPVVKSAQPTPSGVCPNIGKLITYASTLGDGLIVSVHIVVVGLRTIVIGGMSIAPLCPDCGEKECRYAKIIKPNKAAAEGDVRGLSRILHAETTRGHKCRPETQVLR